MVVVVDHIVFEHKFTQVPNRLLTCNRLSKYQILLAVMLNLKSMKMKRNAPNPSVLTISKKELRCVLDFCTEDNIDKQLRGLRDYGIVREFSKQGGIEGTYTVSLAENLEQNPYVLLDMVEKQIMKGCRINSGIASKDYLGNLQKFVKTTAESVEAEYITKLSVGIGAMDEYKEYLKRAIVESGLGTFDEEQQKASIISDNTSDQSLAETVYEIFTNKYVAITGREHSVIKPTALTQISKVINYCGGDKDMVLWFVDKFFESYHVKDPTTALFANDGILSELRACLETGKAPTVYGVGQRTKSASVVKAEQARVAQQENEGIPFEEMIMRMGGKAI
ncbi:hypothetical protein [Brevibacillus laterosporus]|uniref:hypothetical protein n=1 Tax=Brevibacillus laterosporus TaxID=1465 RepID=UPI0026567671|nr:hypothetical protein [Brevibacillus laterosporus]MDN9010711.1 hypothetical protein [Brevibacillus laterosporus]MDO0941726.1 hypothetical protein [Brevibacillus laterosporus]